MALAWTLGGCGTGTHTPTPAELALERNQFMLVARGLEEAVPAIQREVAGARSVWPSLADGLPSGGLKALRGKVSRASSLARGVPEPPFMAHPERLTGPAAGLAGLYMTYAHLCERSWRMIETSILTIAAGPPNAARFADANAPVYLDAIYDSHYDLSLIGKNLASGYDRLGGGAAFGVKLPRAAIDRLTSAYSIAAVRLSPHPGRGAELK